MEVYSLDSRATGQSAIESASLSSLFLQKLVLRKWDCLASAAYQMQLKNYEQAIQILNIDWIFDEPLLPEGLEFPGSNVLGGELRIILLALCYAKLDRNDRAIEELFVAFGEEDLEEDRERLQTGLSFLLDELSDLLVDIQYQKGQVNQILPLDNP